MYKLVVKVHEKRNFTLKKNIFSIFSRTPGTEILPYYLIYFSFAWSDP